MDKTPRNRRTPEAILAWHNARIEAAKSTLARRIDERDEFVERIKDRAKSMLDSVSA